MKFYMIRFSIWEDNSIEFITLSKMEEGGWKRVKNFDSRGVNHIGCEHKDTFAEKEDITDFVKSMTPLGGGTTFANLVLKTKEHFYLDGNNG